MIWEGFYQITKDQALTILEDSSLKFIEVFGLDYKGYVSLLKKPEDTENLETYAVESSFEDFVKTFI